MQSKKLGVGYDEAAADRIVDGGQQHPPVLVEGGEPHAVGMTRQRDLLVEHQVFGGIEMVSRVAGRRDAMGSFNLGDDGIHAVRIDPVRGLAGQADDHRPARSVADAGIGERSVQAGFQRRDLGALRPRPAVGRNQVEKPVSRCHRPHRMGARRAYPDLEHIENRKKHVAAPPPG